MMNFDTSGNKNIGHNHLALEIIRGRIKIIFFPDEGNDSVTTVLPAGFARGYCPQLFAMKLLKWSRS